jgi:exonuclease SbcD
MTTILCTSDLHICATSPRWAECQRVLGWFADLAVREADLVIIAGDLYDRASTPTERTFAAAWLTRIASACPVVIVRGNHDASRDLSILGELRAKHPIHVAEHPEVIAVAGVVVQCLPWPRLGELAARAGESGLALEERARAALGDVLRGLAAEADLHIDDEAMPRMRRILATHTLITGAVTSHGQPLVGGEMVVGLADLALAGADVVIAGHIHKPQEWEHGGVRMLYCGSPFRTAFGEQEDKSVVRILDGEAHHTGLQIMRVPTPAQRMVDVDMRWDAGRFVGDAFAKQALDEAEGNQVRFRYRVDAEHREAARVEAAKLRAAWLDAGAERVVVEAEVVASSTARAPEIAQRTSVAAMLDDLWRVRGDAPADRDGVLGALAELEEG